MFSSTSIAEWTKVNESWDGYDYYVDLERIRNHDGFAYYWKMKQSTKRQGELSGDTSGVSYNKADCRVFRTKTLKWSFHKEPMGGGFGEPSPLPLSGKWKYPLPKSGDELVLKKVCDHKDITN